MSVAYIGSKSRIESRKTKIGTEIAHITLDSDTTFEVKRLRSPGHFTHLGFNAYDGCSGQRGNVFGVGKYCCAASARRRATGEERDGAYCVATRAACYTDSAVGQFECVCDARK